MLDLGRGGDLPRTRVAASRRQPGRQRHLQRRDPRSSRPSSVKASQTITPTSTAPDQRVGGWRHLHPDGHGSLGAAVTFTIDAIDLGVLDLRRRRELHRRRYLHHRRQPGRQRQLHRRPPGPADLHRVGQGSQTITPTSTAPTGAGGGATYTPTRHRPRSGLTVAITIDASASSVCSITAGVVTFQAAGTLHRRLQPGRQRHLQRRAPGPAVLRRRPRPHQTITFTSTAPAGHRGRGDLHPDGHGHARAWP